MELRYGAAHVPCDIRQWIFKKIAGVYVVWYVMYVADIVAKFKLLWQVNHMFINHPRNATQIFCKVFQFYVGSIDFQTTSR